MNNNKLKAIILMLLSSFSFAVMGALVKLAGDIPSIEKAFFRNLVSLLIAIFVIVRRKQNPWGKKENRKFLIGRGICGSMGLLAYFYSIDKLLLADSGMLNKMSPFFVIIFAAIFLKEKIKKYQIVSLIIAILGVIFIIKPSFQFQESIPAFIGLMSGVFAGAAYVFVSYLGNRENAHIIVFYFSFISTIITIPYILFNFTSPNEIQLILLIGTGITAAIGQFLLTYAYKFAPAGEVSIYNYSNVIFSSILGLFLFSEIPDILSFMGYILIILGGYIIYRFGRVKTA
ncbi:DMT family transporter [Defluviitalea phaphyphila]|uniref:DMT family transporter n=1 Tax=Defluviitalea phaphyphila TaxID=1473580 RepID=UPI001FA78722|nr:DMT family transporter [Defluviitalea phaphyphila]